MKNFDKKIKKSAKTFHVPETYHEKVDEILKTIQEDSVPVPKRKPFVKPIIVIAVVCLIITGCLNFSHSIVAEAGFLETFKQTILDFFGIGEEDAAKMGIESEQEESVSKPDLLIELQEVVMDTQNIFAVVKITAPPDLELNDNMTFDYYGFCEGTNFNNPGLIPGVKDCTLLEHLNGKKNVATFVISISTTSQVEEEKDVTVFFKDLIAGPYENTPDVLVEGMWSLSFTSQYADTESIKVQGTEDTTYSLLNTTVAIKEIELMPLGMNMLMDMSNIPVDVLNVSDTSLTIRFQMMDGSEIIVESPNAEWDEMLTSGSSIEQFEEGDKVLRKYVCQFKKAIDVDKVLGVSVKDCYVSMKEYE